MGYITKLELETDSDFGSQITQHASLYAIGIY